MPSQGEDYYARSLEGKPPKQWQRLEGLCFRRILKC